MRSPRQNRRATDQPLWRGGSPDRRTVLTLLGALGAIAIGTVVWLIVRAPVAHDASPEWSRDGQSLVYVDDQPATTDLGVMRLDGTGRRAIELPGREGGPSVSPDGGSIAFDSDVDGNREIYVAGWDGQAPRRVTSHRARDWGPTWTPDGRSIVFMSDRETPGGADIYQVRLNGGPVVRLTQGGDSRYPQVSPDGASVAFERAGDLYVLTLVGGRLRRVTYAPQDGRRPAWSPDGRQIAFVSLRNGRPEIFSVDFEGSNAQLIVSMAVGSATDPRWSPDGTRIAFVHVPEVASATLPERPAHTIYTVELSTGRLSRLSP